MNSYNELSSRNYLYIPPEIQLKIKSTRLCFFGTGLSSTIIIACTRLGFEHFYLCDGDRIELSNLNRQAFTRDDIQELKVNSLKKEILRINPNCNVTVYPQRVEHKDQLVSVVNSSDIIINTIDCNKLYFDLIDVSSSLNKITICPFNTGMGAFVLCFGPNSAKPGDIFDLSQEENLNDIEISRQLFNIYPDIPAPSHGNTTKEEFIENVIEKKYFPQIINGALITSGIVLNIIVEIVKEEAIRMAPLPYCFDPAIVFKFQIQR